MASMKEKAFRERLYAHSVCQAPVCRAEYYISHTIQLKLVAASVDSSWNVLAHGDAREGKWRGNWRMEWVVNTLPTTSKHDVSSITTADAHTSAASSRINWCPLPIYMDSSLSPKDEIWFLRRCHHISNAVRRNLVSAHVPSHFKRSLPLNDFIWYITIGI